MRPEIVVDDANELVIINNVAVTYGVLTWFTEPSPKDRWYRLEKDQNGRIIVHTMIYPEQDVADQ